jgi:endoglycosylceramidase
VILRGFNMVYKVGSYRPEDTGFGRPPAPAPVQLDPARDHLCGPGAEPAGRRRHARLPPRLHPQHRSHRAGARPERCVYAARLQDLTNERFQGEGWPDWQTIDDGLPSEPQLGFPTNYLVNAGLQRAFDNFWANTPVEGRGLQEAYAAAWRRVAAKFDRKPYVMGYDLLNEPWPGSAFGPRAVRRPVAVPVST